MKTPCAAGEKKDVRQKKKTKTHKKEDAGKNKKKTPCAAEEMKQERERERQGERGREQAR